MSDKVTTVKYHAKNRGRGIAPQVPPNGDKVVINALVFVQSKAAFWPLTCILHLSRPFLKQQTWVLRWSNFNFYVGTWSVSAIYFYVRILARIGCLRCLLWAKPSNFRRIFNFDILWWRHLQVIFRLGYCAPGRGVCTLFWNGPVASAAEWGTESHVLVFRGWKSSLQGRSGRAVVVRLSTVICYDMLRYMLWYVRTELQ